MKFSLILGLLILSQAAVAQRDEQGLLPPPPYVPEDDSIPVEKIEPKEVKLMLEKLQQKPKKLPETESAAEPRIGSEYVFEVPQYQFREKALKQERLPNLELQQLQDLRRPSEEAEKQAEALAGCTLSPDGLDINCPFGNFKKDSSTDNSQLRQNTKSDLQENPVKIIKKNRSKTTAQ